MTQVMRICLEKARQTVGQTVGQTVPHILKVRLTNNYTFEGLRRESAKFCKCALLVMHNFGQGYNAIYNSIFIV